MTEKQKLKEKVTKRKMNCLQKGKLRNGLRERNSFRGDKWTLRERQNCRGDKWREETGVREKRQELAAREGRKSELIERN